MASIYDKALKRKDFSGITNKDEKEVASKDAKSKFFPETPFLSIHTLVDKTKAQKKEERDKAAKADDPKAGADVGKIVNLIAGDANRVRNVILFFSFYFFLIPRLRLHEQHLRSILFTGVRIIQSVHQHRLHTLF